MYRDDRWEKGMYADDLVKFRCSSCGDEFIAGRTAVEKANTKGHNVLWQQVSGRAGKHRWRGHGIFVRRNGMLGNIRR